MVINAKNSFLKYLATELPSYTIHNIRHDPSNPGADVFQMNAVNVELLDIAPHIQGSTFRVAVDVVFDSENAAFVAIQDIHSLFKKSYFTPLYDYTVPTAPVAAGGNVYWEPDKVRFTRVISGVYVHYTCVLSLKYA